MFLKSMEIFGFKSFADRSRIEFTPGISALLGPNGCGKSNVVDAIKWVLGEQASRSLRADKMEDIIFNGTESRKALNVAEVTLTLSNEKNVLALDMPEIAIKRRLYRSGESEYFINSTPVKLKEVRELFYDTGVGKSAYSVMEQGRIDQILSTKPEERRYLFEEAAGITKYRARGLEAERKLEKTEENIRQIEGIIGEVKRNYEVLKKQAEKTLVYRTLRKEIFEHEKILQLAKLRGSTDERDKLKNRLDSETEKRSKAKETIDALNQSMEKSLTEVNNMESGLIELQKRLYGLDLEKNAFENQMRMQNERLGQNQNQLSLNESKAKTLAEKKTQLQDESVRRQTDRENLQNALKECLSNIRDFEKNIETARLQIVENDRHFKDGELKLIRLEKDEGSFQEQLRETTDKLVAELDQRLKDQGFSWSALPELTKHMVTDFQSLEILLSGRRDLLKTVAETGKFPENDPRSFTQRISSSLDDAILLTRKLHDGWKTYQKAVPTFLEDFLSPEGIMTQKRSLESNLEKLRTETRQTRDHQRELTEENRKLNVAVEEYRKNLEELKLAEVRMNTQIASLEESISRLNREVSEQEIHIQDNAREQDLLLKRLTELQEEIRALQEKLTETTNKDQTLRTEAQTLEKAISEKNQGLLSKEREMKSHIETLNTIQGELEKLQIRNAQIEAEIRALFDHFRDKHSVELSEFEKEAVAEQPAGQDLRELLAQKKEELKNLGQVNFMAVEEFAEVEERHDFLTKQLADLKKAREDLHQVTKEIRRESAVLFEAAFQEIKKNFNLIFRRLFGGGRAELRLLDPQNVLESGIEMLCQPPGKKLESINLLSGGEKSMTAVALLFATFMVKPSPFCILDEIDAALDESNVGRFVNMLSEFAAQSQFVVITHNKKTVTGASTMIGVTMEEPGISKIIAVRLSHQAGEASA